MKSERFSQWRTGLWEPKCGPCDPTVQSTWNFKKNLNFLLIICYQEPQLRGLTINTQYLVPPAYQEMVQCRPCPEYTLTKHTLDKLMDQYNASEAEQN